MCFLPSYINLQKIRPNEKIFFSQNMVRVDPEQICFANLTGQVFSSDSLAVFIGFFIDFLDLWRIELQHPGLALPPFLKRWEGEQTACLPVGRDALLHPLKFADGPWENRTPASRMQTGRTATVLMAHHPRQIWEGKLC
jgi:hypothetical protein